MKRLLVAIVLLGFTGTAWAQASSMTQTGADATRLYAGAVGGVTFGHVTSGMFGGEVGYRIGESIEVFAEGGRFMDVTAGDTEDAAAAIGGYLSGLGRGTATYSVESPANYGAAGLRYIYTTGTPYEFYGALTAGMANLEHKATFALNGADVTGQVADLGVQLGKDLAGKTNSFLFTAGAGVRAGFGRCLFDLGLRYGRIFSDPGANTFRLYAGVGYRF